MPSYKAIETAAEACARPPSAVKFSLTFCGWRTPREYLEYRNLERGRSRDHCPGQRTVLANGSTTLTVTVSAPQGSTVQGWVNLDGEGENDLHFAYYARVGP